MCKSTKELVTALHGHPDLRPGSEALTQQEPLQPTKLLMPLLRFHDKNSSISQITRTLKA